MNQSVRCELESFIAPVFHSAFFFFELPCPIIATFCVRRPESTKIRTEHHLSKWRSVVTTATVFVDCLDRKNNLLEMFQRR